MKVGVVLISHGSMSSGLLSALEMIAGAQDGVASVPFPPGVTPDSLLDATVQAVESVDRGAGVLLLVDLFGGTPAHVAAGRIKLRGDVAAVTGVNLPMLLEVCVRREGASLAELRQVALESGPASVIDIGERLAGLEVRELSNAGSG